MKTIFCSALALLLCMSGAQAQDFFRLVSSGSKKALHVERGSLELGEIEPGWWSAMWERGTVGQGVFIFRNRYTGQYLVSSDGNKVTTTAEEPSKTGTGPHFFRYVQPFPDQTKNALATQSGVNLIVSGSNILIQEVIPETKPEVPVPIVYQQILYKNQLPLHVEQGSPTFGPAQPGWWSAMWEVKDVHSARKGAAMIFINRYTGQLLSSSGSTLTTQPFAQIQTGEEPFIWQAVRNGKNLEFLSLSNSQGARLDQISLKVME